MSCNPTNPKNPTTNPTKSTNPTELTNPTAPKTNPADPIPPEPNPINPTQLSPDQTELPIERRGALDEDELFSTVKDKYRKELEGRVVNPEMLAEINDPNILKLTTDTDGVFFTKERFELIVDLRGYKPENIRCIVTDNAIEIIALRNDPEMTAGTQKCQNSSSMSRRYQLPSSVNPQNSMCNLSSEGFLYISVPWNK